MIAPWKFVEYLCTSGDSSRVSAVSSTKCGEEVLPLVTLGGVPLSLRSGNLFSDVKRHWWVAWMSR